MIKQMGIEKFRKAQKYDKKYAKLEYLELPKCYKWIWEQFYSMWSLAERDMNVDSSHAAKVGIFLIVISVAEIEVGLKV